MSDSEHCRRLLLHIMIAFYAGILCGLVLDSSKEATTIWTRHFLPPIVRYRKLRRSVRTRNNKKLGVKPFSLKKFLPILTIETLRI